MPTLSSKLPSRLFDTARDFGRWWIGEWQGMLPTGPRWSFLPSTKRAEVRPGRQQVEIVRFTRDEGERFVETEALSAFEDVHWAETAALLDGYRPHVLLTPPHIHVLTLRLPKAARAHLRSAIPLQLRDHAPLLPELLEWTIVDQAVQGEFLSVRVVLVRIATLDVIEQGFLDHALSAPPILADLGDGRRLPLRAGRRPAGTRTASRSWWIAAALLASTPLWMLAALHLAIADQQAKVAVAEQMAQPRLGAEKRLRERSMAARALKILLERPSATATIDGLAAALPATAHATELSLPETGPLAITLRTSDADGVGRALAKDPGLAHVMPTGQSAAADGSVQLGFTAILS